MSVWESGLVSVCESRLVLGWESGPVLGWESGPVSAWESGLDSASVSGLPSAVGWLVHQLAGWLGGERQARLNRMYRGIVSVSLVVINRQALSKRDTLSPDESNTYAHFLVCSLPSMWVHPATPNEVIPCSPFPCTPPSTFSVPPMAIAVGQTSQEGQGIMVKKPCVLILRALEAFGTFSDNVLHEFSDACIAGKHHTRFQLCLPLVLILPTVWIIVLSVVDLSRFAPLLCFCRLVTKALEGRGSYANSLLLGTIVKLTNCCIGHGDSPALHQGTAVFDGRT